MTYIDKKNLFTKKIFKYEIPIVDKFNLELTVDSKILSFQIQNGKPTIWVLIDESKATQKHYFSLYGTGQTTYIDSYSLYIGTIQHQQFVWHLFHDSGLTASAGTQHS